MTGEIGLPPDARSAARSAAYRLLARLFLREVTPDLLPVLAGLPTLGDALPEPFDPDEAAAEHHRLFGLEVPPWAGVFVDPEGRIGGDAAAVVRDLYARAGLELDERSDEADHVGHTLALLAELGDAHNLAAETLDRALLGWLPWLVEAVDRHGQDFHRALAGLTLELAVDHRAELRRPPALLPVPAPVPDPLDEPRSGLRRIAVFLVTPAQSGLYLSRQDVRTMAAAEGLPSGFGGRADSLETLLRTAVDIGDVGRVLDRLHGLVDAGRATCDALERQAVPGTSAPVALRRGRLAATARVLLRLRDVASQADASGQADSSIPGSSR